MNIREYLNSSQGTSSNKKTNVIYDYVGTTEDDIEKRKKQQLLNSIKQSETSPSTIDGDSGFFQDIIDKPTAKDTNLFTGTIGTAADVTLGVGKGILRLGEGIGDMLQYGTAGLLDLFGADNAADSIRKNAQENAIDILFDEWLKKPTDWVESHSIAGETTDKIAEGIGYVIGVTNGSAFLPSGAQSVNVAGFKMPTLSIVSGTSNAMTDAYNAGASDTEALIAGTIGGLGEGFAESLFSGLGTKFKAVFGGSPLDDVLIQKATSKISNNVAKKLVDMGLRATGEGMEEIVSGVTSAIGKKLSYMSEKELTELLQDENLLESFLMGTAISFISQAPSSRYAFTNTDVIEDSASKEENKSTTNTPNISIDVDTNKNVSSQQSVIQSQIQQQKEYDKLATQKQTEEQNIKQQEKLKKQKEKQLEKLQKSLNKSSIEKPEEYSINTKQSVGKTTNVETVNGKQYNEYNYYKDQMPKEVTAKFDAKSNDAVNLYSTMGEQQRPDKLMKKLVNNMQDTMVKTTEPLVLYRGSKQGEVFSDKMVRSTTMSTEVADSGYAAREKQGTVYKIYVDPSTPVTYTTQTADPRYKKPGEYWNRSREVILYPELYNIKQDGNNVYVSPKTDAEIEAILKENAKNKDISTDDARELLGLNRRDSKQTLNKETKSDTNDIFKSIEDSYAKANKYTGEIKDDLLKTTQKEYNKYRDAGGDKTISALEEKYQAKKQIAKVLNKDATQTNTYTPEQANVTKQKYEIFINKYQRQINDKSSKNAKLAEMRNIVDKYMEDVSKGMEPIEQYEKWKNEVEIHDNANKNIASSTTEEVMQHQKEIKEETVQENKESVTGNVIIDNVVNIPNITTSNNSTVLDEQLAEIDKQIEELQKEIDTITGNIDKSTKKLAKINKKLDNISSGSLDGKTKNTLNKSTTKVEKVTNTEDVSTEPQNSEFNMTYNEQQISGNITVDMQHALGKREKNRKKRVENADVGIEQLFLDMYKSFRNIDLKNKNNNVMTAQRQRSTVNMLANQSINGTHLISNDYEVLDIPSVKVAFEPITSMPTDMRNIAQQYIVLQMDGIYKMNQEAYGIDYANNIFQKYSVDDIVQEIESIEKTYPDLVKVVTNDVMPNVRKIIKALNNMKVKSGVMAEKITVSKEIAKNELHMSDAEIKSFGKQPIRVNTVDYYAAMNPWYIPISREQIKTGADVVKNTDKNIPKLKGRQEGAEKYPIQNMVDGMAEKVAGYYYTMAENNLRKAIAEGWSNITSNEVTEFTKPNGKISAIVNAGEGNITMNYLVNNAKGENVYRTIHINQNIANAYNGIDAVFKQFQESTIGKVFKAKAKLQKAMVTKFNLPWQVKNVVMDFGDALINNEFNFKGNILFIKNELMGYSIDKANNTAYYQEFSAMRGKYLTSVETKGYVQEETGVNKTLSKMNNLLETGELTTRYALYKTARQLGYSQVEAQRMMTEGTTDFSKTGALWSSLDNCGATVFLGANVAGINRFLDSTINPITNAVKVARDNYKKTGSTKATNEFDSKIMKRGVSQAIKIGLIYGLGREMLKSIFDSDDMKEAIEGLSDTEIQNNFIIPIDGSSVIKIPKGRIWRTMDAMTDLLTGDTIREEDKMDVIETLAYMIDNVGVSGIDSSTTFSNFISIVGNKDYWGNEIYDPNGTTGEKAKASIDYLIKQYGSIYYKTFKYINGGTDINPWTSTFYTDTTSISSYNNRFYNMKDAYSNIYSKDIGKFDSDSDMQNYFKYRVLNYEKTNGELGTQLSILKALKADTTSSLDDIRKQEDKVRRIYQELYLYIDSNEAIDYSALRDKSVIYFGAYRFTKNKEGSYVKDRK